MTSAEAFDLLADAIADRVAARIGHGESKVTGFETVSIPKAAKLAGIAPGRMRKWVADGIVPTVQIPGEQPLIRLAALEQAMRLYEQGAEEPITLRTQGRRVVR